MTKTEISILNKNQTIMEFLLGLGFSKSRIKNFSFSPKWLGSKVSNSIELPIDFINQNIVNPLFEGERPEILFEDGYFLVLWKPKNCHCQPHVYSETKTMVNFLRSINSKAGRINQGEMDRGLLHRLDFETDGVLVFCKEEDVYGDARKRFHQIFSEKVYLAITNEKPNQDGKISLQLSPFGEGRKKMKVTEQGDLAELELRSIQGEDGRFFNFIKLNHGRRHQIRVTLAHLGAPIVGDSLYGGKAYDQLLLTAYRYDWSYQKKSYSVSLPDRLFNRPDFDGIGDMLKNELIIS